jgi:diguanylate cyclase (GGDEF)-like protein/PAS domain S-box-containing protein
MADLNRILQGMRTLLVSWPERWRQCLLTAILFYLAGRLALPLSWYESNTGAIWPPAGIGLGAVLLWGNAVLPGIYFADLLLHLGELQLMDTALKKAVFVIAPLAAVLRSWLGGYLVKKFADYPNELVSLRRILLFFVLAGPLATLAPAILSTIFLYFKAITPERELQFSLLYWWLGDSSGVAVFTPLFLVYFNTVRDNWRQRLLSFGLPLLLLYSVVAVGYLYAHAREVERLNTIVQGQAQAIKSGLRQEFNQQVSALDRFKSLSDKNVLTENSFLINALADFKQNPGLTGIVMFKTEYTGKNYRLIKHLSTYNPDASVNLIDLDKILKGKLVYSQEPLYWIGKQNYLIAVPGLDSSSKSCKCIRTLVVGIFTTQKTLQKVLANGNYANFLAILKNEKDFAGPITESNQTAQSLDLLKLAKLEIIPFGQDRWALQISPGQNFLAEYYSWSPWQLLVGGMFLTGFVSIGLLALTGQTESVTAQVEQRTRELRSSNLKLAAREKQFRNLVQTQSAIVWRADPVTFNFVFVSAEAASILGYPIKQWLEENEFWQKRLHPEDKENVLWECDKAISQARNKNFDLEYRMIADDGHIVWLRDVVTIVVEDGVVTELFGFMIDITKQKFTEEQLRLAANTFEAQQGIMITDKDANILRVNKAFTQITGYPPHQVIGQNPKILKSGRHDQAFFENYWHQLLSYDKFEGEIWNRRKNGEIYPEWQTVTAVRNDMGEISHYVSVFSDITEKKDAENKIHNMAFYDPLTNLPNRRLVLDRFDQEIALSRRHKQFGAILYLDLDHFKILNDSQGHLAGDELLIQVAQRLASVLREEDTPARLGGDEFVVLLHANSETLSAAGDNALVVAEKIREQLNIPFDFNNFQHQIGVSIGIALFPEGEESPDVILQQADTAMYRSKSSGRNTISFFQPSMQEAADLRLSLEQDLRGAIEHGHFVLCYHAQMDANGKMQGAEALIRWEDTVKGRLSPADFIPVAEESNLILTIGKWVLIEACNQIKTWQEAGLDDLPYLSINVSSRQFRQQDFVNQVKQAIENTGIAPQRLGIELTESVMIADTQDTIDKMKALKALGVSIAVDDFGTGYSSLVYLKKLPIDVLKIDRGFVRDILNDSNDAVIVETIISMARHLNIKVIAEGVETAEQLDFLKVKGCSLFQGYHFNQPLTAADFAEIYLKNKRYFI